MATLKIIFTRNTATIQFTLVDAAGSAIDLSGATVTLSVAAGRDSVNVIEKDCDLADDPTTGICSVALDADDTDIEPGKYIGELYIDWTDRVATVDIGGELMFRRTMKTPPVTP